VPSVSGARDGREGPRRYFIAIGARRYDHLAEEDWLPSVPGDIGDLIGLFCDHLGYRHVLPELTDSPTAPLLRQRLGAWLLSDERDPDDIVVVYYTGHGVKTGGRHYLLTRDSQPQLVSATAFPTEEFAWILGEDSRVQHMLVMIDACYAGSGANDLGRVAATVTETRRSSVDSASGLWFLAAARPRDEALESVFSSCFTAAVRHLPRTGSLQAHISLDTLVGQLNDMFAAQGLAQRARIGAADGSGEARFIPNLHREAPGSQPAWLGAPADRASQWLASDIAEHWLPRARGAGLSSDPGSYFSGRTAVLRSIVAWLDNPEADHRARVITGAPGSGKSAVLARLVVLSHPEHRQSIPTTGVHASTVPRQGSIHVAIHARNRDLPDIVAMLATELGWPHLSTADQLLDAIGADPKPRVIAMDGIDEANDPVQLFKRLIRPLLQRSARLDVRLLLAARTPLIKELGSRAAIFDLDNPAFLVEDDLADYALKILLAQDEPEVTTPYRGNRELAVRLARAIARRASPVFLIARMAARSLASAQAPVSMSATAWQQLLPDTVGQAFDAYLERFGEHESRVRDLLRPLAWAEGNGLPWEQIWAPAARAMSGGTAYSNDDIRWLHSVASAYIVESTSGGRSVYRLYHQALADHLRSGMTDAQAHSHLVRALLGTVPSGSDGCPDWSSAHPYILANLATHAGGAGLLDEIVADASYLLRAEPDRLLRAFANTHHGVAVIQSVYQRNVHRLRETHSAEAAAYMALSARQHGADALAEDFSRFAGDVLWSARWARCRRGQPYRQAGRHDGPANAVVLTHVYDRPTIVSAGADGLLRTWDIARGTATGDPLRGSGHAVRALLKARLNGRPGVVSGDDGGILHFWDLLHRRAAGDPLPAHQGAVRALALHSWGETDLIFSGGDDGAIHRFEARMIVASGEPLVRPIAGLHRRTRRSAVTALAMSRIEQTPVVVAGFADDTIHAWDALRGRRLAGPLDGHRRGVHALACAVIGDQPIVFSGGGDGMVRAWDIKRGKQIRDPFAGHRLGVYALSVRRVENRLLIASGSWDGIRVWDWEAGDITGDVLTGHPQGVFAVSLTQHKRRPVLVSGGSDGTVRIWDWARETSIQPVDHDAGTVALATAVLDGRPVVVSGGTDGPVRVLSWENANEVYPPLAGHKVGVDCLAVIQVDDRPVAVTGAGDESLRRWDLRDRALLGQPIRGHRRGVRAISVAERHGGPVIVCADGVGCVRLVDGEDIRVISEHPATTALAALSLDGQLVIAAGGNDGWVRIHTVIGAKVETVKLASYEPGPACLAARHFESGPILARGGADGRVSLWNLRTRTPCGPALGRHRGRVSAVAFGQIHGKAVVVSGCTSGEIRVHGLDGTTLAMIDVGVAVTAVAVVSLAAGVVVGARDGIVAFQFADPEEVGKEGSPWVPSTW